MAVTAKHLTSGEGGTGFSTKNTGTITPTANKLVLLAVSSKIAASDPNIPTATGCNLTWVQVATLLHTTAQRPRVTLFRALGASPATGTIAIDWAGQNQDRAVWSVDQFDNTVITGANGADAIVQSATGTVGGTTALTVTLGAFGDSNNATYGVIDAIGPPSLTPGGGFTELATANSAESGIEIEFKNFADTTVDWSSSSADLGGIAAEIKAQAIGGLTTNKYW